MCKRVSLPAGHLKAWTMCVTMQHTDKTVPKTPAGDKGVSFKKKSQFEEEVVFIRA